ncbi:PglL family O-oligosaccharyltransferase [Undibacterium squillarum]|nr:O-antigen ligase family protein [Undibacterium squillarum]
MKNYLTPRAAVVAFSIGTAFSVLVPFHIHPLRSFWNDFVSFYALFLAFLLLSFLNLKTWRWTKLSLLPIALLGIFAIQLLCIDGIFGWDLLLPAMYLLALPFAFGLGATISESRENFDYFCFALSCAFVISAVCSVVVQLMQVGGIRLSPWIMAMPVSGWSIRPYANLGQPNQLALWITFGLSAVWYLFRQGKFSGVLAYAISALLAFGLALTQSRIGWIILPAMFCLFIFYPRERKRSLWGSGISIALLYFFFVFGLPLLLAHFNQENSAGVVARIGGRSERLGLYQHALHMLQAHPLLGVGWGQFGEHQVMIASEFSSTTYSEHAHNLVMQFAAEIGVIATSLILGILGYWSFRVYLQAKELDGLMFIFGCLVAIGVHSMVEFPLWYAYVLIPAAVLMGAADGHVSRGTFYRAYPLVGIVVFGVVIVFSVFLIRDHNKVVSGFNQLRSAQSDKSGSLAIVTQPTYTALPYYYRYFELMRIEPVEKMSLSDIQFLERWSLRFGFVHIINKLAEVHALNGMEDAAVKDMMTLQKLHPDRYPEYYDYWYSKSAFDFRYGRVVSKMPARNSP